MKNSISSLAPMHPGALEQDGPRHPHFPVHYTLPHASVRLRRRAELHANRLRVRRMAENG
jgi:hypothetical protein